MQILFEYLPEKTFDYEHGQSICKVNDIEYDEVRDVGASYILRRVDRFLRQWPENMRRFYPPTNNTLRYVFARPNKVISEVFPLVFRCTNKACMRTYSYNISELEHRPKTKCPVCKSRLIQLQHVLIHGCGNIEPLWIPSCPIHGKDHIMLDNRPQRYKDMRWVCRACGDKVIGEYLGKKCSDCGLRGNMHPAVHSSSSAYYPQYITLVNLPGKELDRIFGDSQYRYFVIAAYLGLFDHPKTRLNEVMVNENGASLLDETIGDLERLLRALPEEQRKATMEILRKTQVDLQNTQTRTRSNLIPRVEQLLSDRQTSIEDITEEIFEYVKLEEELSFKTLDDLITIANNEGWTHRIPKIKSFKNTMERAGISNVRLIEDFPVTSVIIGYTRVERDPGKAILRSFPIRDRENARVPLYFETTKTEAIIFELNHRKVLKWLYDNHFAATSPDGMDDMDVKAWFLRNMVSINPFDEIPANTEQERITRATYVLVHSMSHAFLRQAAILSGFERTSLSEYIFPRALAFAIYYNNRHEFNIGGLHTMFEQNLNDWFNLVWDNANICVYDPVCNEHGASCHACMHISEMSCTHFNRNLSRHHLFGGKGISANTIIGYWEDAYAITNSNEI